MEHNIADQSGKQICNFRPNVVEIDEIHDAGGKVVSNIQFRLEFEDGTSSMQTTQVAELDHVQWWNMDKRCWINPDVSRTKAQRYLEDAVRQQLSSAPKKEIYQLSEAGLFLIKGEAIFCTGREAIRSPASVESHVITVHQSKEQNLDIDIGISEEEAVSGIFDLISLSPDPGRVMLTYQILYLMRQAYVDAGAKPNFCIYLHGKTGTKKTTFSSLLTQVYNRGKGIESPTRLDVSISAAVKILTGISDDTVVLDDLCPAESNRIRGQQEETLIEITRFIGDGTVPVRVKGKELLKDSPKCGVIFTGEYVIGSGSDAARLLPVEMMPPDGARLKFFQDRPLLVSTFYYFYVKWFIANYKEIIILLKEWLNNYRKVNLGVHGRLQEMHFFLNSAFAMLMQYCVEKEVLSDSDAVRLHNSFCILILDLVRQQDGRVQRRKPESPKAQDYLGRIRELYKGGQLSLEDGVKQFDTSLHDGLVYRKRLYIRGEKLLAYFPDSTIEDLADALDAQGVLETGKNSRTKQISSLKGMRFYVIPLFYLD